MQKHTENLNEYLGEHLPLVAPLIINVELLGNEDKKEIRVHQVTINGCRYTAIVPPEFVSVIKEYYADVQKNEMNVVISNAEYVLNKKTENILVIIKKIAYNAKKRKELPLEPPSTSSDNVFEPANKR